MPELPEVHTITTDLNKYLKGYKITDVWVEKGYKAIPTNQVFVKEVTGTKIVGAKRIAKNILIELGSGNFIIIHLAMTGQVLFYQQEGKSPRWGRAILTVSNNENTQKVAFTDMRMFGKIGVLSKKALLELTKRYGPDITKDNLTKEEFLKNLKSKKTNIKNALMDQAIISGLGNIYVTDTLFLSGTHPKTSTTEITLETAGRILKFAKEVLNEGIKNRGSTLPDKAFVDIFGKEGTQQNHFKIYMKALCPNCKTKVEYIKINGRGTYFCPNCQPTGNQKTLFSK